MPATSPERSTSAPPLDHPLLAASVSSKPEVVGPVADATIASADDSRPLLIHGVDDPDAGAPTTHTELPGRNDEVASCAAGSSACLKYRSNSLQAAEASAPDKESGILDTAKERSTSAKVKVKTLRLRYNSYASG